MPGAAWLPPHRLGALSESSAKLVAPATDRFVRDHDATLEQQLLDVAQAQAEPEVPANGAADDDSRETVAAIKRFGLLHRFILPPHLQQPDSAPTWMVLHLHSCSVCGRSALRRSSWH